MSDVAEFLFYDAPVYFRTSAVTAVMDPAHPA